VFIFTDQKGELQPRNNNLPYDNTAGNAPGKVRKVYNSDGTVRYDVWLYNGTGGALVAGRPYIVKSGSTKALPQTVLAPSAAVAFPVTIVFPTTALADATWGWFTFAGYSDDIVLVKGTGVAAGRYLKVSGGDPTALLDDGTALTASSIGHAFQTGLAGAATKQVLLYGVRVQVAA
jgi:hypothetical protein